MRGLCVWVKRWKYCWEFRSGAAKWHPWEGERAPTWLIVPAEVAASEEGRREHKKRKEDKIAIIRLDQRKGEIAIGTDRQYHVYHFGRRGSGNRGVFKARFFFFVSSLRDIWTQRPTYRNLPTTPTIPTCFLFIYQLNLLPHDLANAPTFQSKRVDFRCRRAPSFL